MIAPCLSPTLQPLPATLAGRAGLALGLALVCAGSLGLEVRWALSRACQERRGVLRAISGHRAWQGLTGYLCYAFAVLAMPLMSLRPPCLCPPAPPSAPDVPRSCADAQSEGGHLANGAAKPTA